MYSGVCATEKNPEIMRLRAYIEWLTYVALLPPERGENLEHKQVLPAKGTFAIIEGKQMALGERGKQLSIFSIACLLPLPKILKLCRNSEKSRV